MACFDIILCMFMETMCSPELGAVPFILCMFMETMYSPELGGVR